MNGTHLYANSHGVQHFNILQVRKRCLTLELNLPYMDYVGLFFGPHSVQGYSWKTRLCMVAESPF